jgi:hypothetical protein
MGHFVRFVAADIDSAVREGRCLSHQMMQSTALARAAGTLAGPRSRSGLQEAQTEGTYDQSCMVAVTASGSSSSSMARVRRGPTARSHGHGPGGCTDPLRQLETPPIGCRNLQPALALDCLTASGAH